ncbi:putative rhodanese-related sulfurtransferase [Poriferisphaera corsica]|uniref:tRNA uridine(34) hydroxylase n=1 Tax=Poriferisphaera corsica TaxID=2528020 RepID=A0A517YYW6_9BACT|nr:rhodanese-related sulfurtransferase [Poriferisphaera corsica]QDU35418.1 putative rhodanese-related sulfurtransferase [Poriferisphaera corsica]
MPDTYIIAALYHFTKLEDFKDLRVPLMDHCKQYNITGTLLLAAEGINGTIAGSRSDIDSILTYLRSDPRLANLDHKESTDTQNPFRRMKVRLKKEIVTMGVPDIDPNQTVGTYVSPQDWNNLLNDPDTILVDTRNDYEYAIGTFKNAIDPQTESFREFPEWIKQNLPTEQYKDKKIAMFCTGGIRCEKATAYMRQLGFPNVYHLKGGILKYLETVPEEQSLWEGDCYVFDGRVSVKHNLVPGNFDMCYACGLPITQSDTTHADYEPGVSCPTCISQTTDKQKDRFRDRQRQLTTTQS